MSFQQLYQIINEGRLGPTDIRKLRENIEKADVSDNEREDLLMLLSEKNSFCGSSSCDADGFGAWLNEHRHDVRAKFNIDAALHEDDDR